MSSGYFEIGSVENIKDATSFKWEHTRKLYNTCLQNKKAFEIIERQYRINDDGQLKEESIIVDCLCLSIGSRNKIGIRSRERLALRCFLDNNFPYNVSPLRKDFPLTVHQMFILHDEPTMLCLYEEPWNECERTWTPQRFLKRIVHWLTAAANDSLHLPNQDLEELFFEAPTKIYLPANLIEQASMNKSLEVIGICNEGLFPLHLLTFYDDKSLNNKNPTNYGIFIKIDASITHGHVEMPPKSLEDLNNYFAKHGTSFISILREKIFSLLGTNFYEDVNHKSKTIIICHIPICRSDTSKPELEKIFGYMVECGIISLAIKLDVAGKAPNGSYVSNAVIIGWNNDDYDNSKLADIKLCPIEIRQFYTENQAREASGINDGYTHFDGVLGGVGSLGSSLADIWTREGWGNWSYIDDDTLEPHNLVRHIAYVQGVAMKKVDVVHKYSLACYQSKESEAFVDKINNFSNKDILAKLKSAALIVDATTSIDAPRDLALCDELQRCVSTFISPSGTDSVMLFEDKERKTRLDILEYQYYRLIIQKDWGEKHLENANGNMWVGAGCRETSTIMPYDIIKMHSGLLARQIRMWFDKQEAIIKVFQYNDETGAVAVYSKTCAKHSTISRDDWKVIYDTELESKISELRNSQLPSETGGVLVGYRDHKTKRTYIVDALPAPSDSIQTKDSFIRGCDQLQSRINEIKERTASIVDYIGEWHSHPEGCSTAQSILDIKLFAHLKEIMKEDGLPVIMVIAGDDELKIHFNGDS